MRFFFLGPRIFGIRPGISLGASDFRKAFQIPAHQVPMIPPPARLKWLCPL
jgi:hypothetical protein